MKKTAIIIFLSFGIAGCNNSAQTANEVSQTSNRNLNAQRANNSASVVSSHSTVKSATPAAAATTSPSNSTAAGNSPMAKAIDVSKETADIEKAEKAYKAKTNDDKSKSALAEAYFVRAFALTEAAQYRSALGDFRKGLKLNPNGKEAKEMHDRIISIFQSINRQPPKEGEEPPPLPFDKSS